MGLIIENAKVREYVKTVSIRIEDGVIREIGRDLSGSDHRRIDAAGNLVTPSYANPHIHLDQVFTASEHPNESGTFGEAFELNREVKQNYTVEGILDRAREATEIAVQHGNTHLRGFADVDGYSGLTGLKALNQLKDEYSDLIDLEVCAFAQEGMGESLHPEGEEILREGMELGADVVGGIPWIEHGEEDMKHHVDVVFELADEYDKTIHFLIDDTDSTKSRALEYVARRTICEGFQGRVTCSHARALAAYDDYHAEKVIDLVAQADIHVLSNTQVILFLAAHRDSHPISRGITRVKELLKSDVNVAVGQDDASDMWYPFGMNDMLELAWCVCHAAQLSSDRELQTAYDMITTNAATAMGHDDHGLTEGTPADMVVLDAESVREAIATRADKTHVIKDGTVVAKTTTERKLLT